MKQAKEIQSLSKRLYEQTKAIHQQVENNSFMQQLSNHKLSIKSYSQYLIDLYQIYHALEEGMKKNIHIPFIKKMFFEKLCRAEALKKDYESFETSEVKPTLPALEYASHLKEISIRAPLLLLAHAYVRYLGDLSGGRMMQKHVKELFPGEHTAFYDFEELLGSNPIGAKVVEFKNLWKKNLDDLDLNEEEQNQIIEEAKLAFVFAGRMLDALESS